MKFLYIRINILYIKRCERTLCLLLKIEGIPFIVYYFVYKFII